jgi:hypothetical protein
VTEESPPRWEFGERALDQTTRLASALRRVVGLAASLEGEDPCVEELIGALEIAQSRMAALAPADGAPRVGTGAHPSGRVYLDHARDVGTFNPCFPLYDIHVEGDTATGSVNFPLAYEGPPGLVHGGFIAVLFDTIIQHHNCDVGRAGKTTSLDVTYRRPTPLATDLRFSVRRTDHGDRISSSAVLMDEGRVLCEAAMSAVAADRSTLPEISPRRIDRAR